MSSQKTPGSDKRYQQSANLTRVRLIWVQGQYEHWLRFGQSVGEQFLNRREKIESFAPGSIFAFVRWAANDHGTIWSSIDILRATEPGETFQTVAGVEPGGELLLHISGWPKVQQVLQLIDAIEALGIAPEDVATGYWRHVHNRLTSGLQPRLYTSKQHRAFQQRQRLLS